jgi:ankyrin repeat protein
MFQFFLIITLSFASLDFANAAQQQKLQNLDEINADLKAKKAALEPFDSKKIKVDLESLGLDNVDKKPEQKKSEENKSEEKKTIITNDEVKENFLAEKKENNSTIEEKNLPAPQLLTPKINKKVSIKTKNSKQYIKKILPKSPSKPESATIALTPSAEEKAAINTKFSTIKKPVKKITLTNKKIPTKITKIKSKKTTEQYLNSKHKKNLKKRIEKEIQDATPSEKKMETGLKKLDELRQKYIFESEQNIKLEQDRNDNLFDNSQKILPLKKDLNPFLSEEMPALPILNRFRSSDNKHIPIILTPKERLDILFSSISIGSVSYFNETFKDIQNPNAKNDHGDTILTYSLLLKKYPIIASIIGKGADVNMPNKLGYTPVNIAIEMLDFKELEILANNKADLNYTDSFGRTYLMHAARVGFLPAVDLLVAQGVDINAMDSDGFTALSIAYRHKKELIVQYLLKNDAKTWIEKPYDPKQRSLIKELENRWQ